jgi:hypothetical protein
MKQVNVQPVSLPFFVCMLHVWLLFEGWVVRVDFVHGNLTFGSMQDDQSALKEARVLAQLTNHHFKNVNVIRYEE